MRASYGKEFLSQTEEEVTAACQYELSLDSRADTRTL